MEIGFGSMLDELIRNMKEYAKENNVPIMTEGGINYLMKYIKKNNIRKILEVGTAIGYSAILMCSVDENISITTIERDEKRYLEALKNIKKAHMEDRIDLIYKDALDVNLLEEYDLIFIDAAKAQNRNFFERFKKNLANDGTIITDNMNFHGLVNKDLESIESRNLRQLVRKVKEYREFLENNKEFTTDFFDIGDGIAVSRKA